MPAPCSTSRRTTSTGTAHARLCGGEGAHFRQARRDGRQPRRPAGRSDGAAAGDRKAESREPIERDVVRFGLDAPQRRRLRPGRRERHGLAGARARSRQTLKRAQGRRAGRSRRDALQRLMPADALRVRGRHNAANALAALALATAIGCPLAPMLHGLREYHGEPHRVEYIATRRRRRGLRRQQGHQRRRHRRRARTVWAPTRRRASWSSSSAATARARTSAAGGAGGAPCARRGAVGRDAAAIEAALADSGVPMQRHDTLEAAVEALWTLTGGPAVDKTARGSTGSIAQRTTSSRFGRRDWP